MPKTYTIYSPNADFDGVSAGVQFKKGKGRGTRRQAARLVVRGYECAAVEADVVEATERALSGTPAPTPATAGLNPAAVEAAIEDLRQIDKVGPVIADKIRIAGYPSVRALSVADVGDLAHATGETEQTVTGWVAQAREIVAPPAVASSGTDLEPPPGAHQGEDA